MKKILLLSLFAISCNGEKPKQTTINKDSLAKIDMQRYADSMANVIFNKNDNINRFADSILLLQ
jgi:hypothetical protein